ncbi:MAG TPA: hypothetical protein DHD79_05385 [Firmicutes bacterium]|nr:hypothetical protein [Bacillota bacterium]HAZ21834.1 hypothetical protein [Bacillota bacterium]HBE06778.1 hypothetical protein [Bacillota bacterium]HBG44349.1 hypothetical protein [Bacillota bacterium]HBL50423.1 hypothetical protein [Bacillota bacterium]
MPQASQSRRKVGSVSIAMTVIGTIVGAGFATGQEIAQFFVRYGRLGLLGMAITTILFCVVIIMFLTAARQPGSGSYADLLKRWGGVGLGGMVDLALTIFLMGITGVMFAGAGASFQALGWPAFAGTALTLIITFVAVWSGLRGVMAVNAIVVPIMLSFTVIICLLTLISHSAVPTPVPAPMAPVDPIAPTAPDAIGGGGGGAGWAWLWAAAIYVSYNMILSFPVLVPLGQLASRSKLITAGVLAGGTLGLMGTAVFMAIYLSRAVMLEVPLLHVAARYGRPLQVLYGIVVWGEIMTTAVGNIFGVARRFAADSKIPYRLAVGIAITVSLLISRFGFAALVGNLYPFFGWAGIIFASIVLCRAAYLRIHAKTRR